MNARSPGRLAAPSALAAFVLVALAIASVAPAARAAESALGTITVKGQTSVLRHVVVTRETDPEDTTRTWLVLLVSDRPVAPADRSPARLRELAVGEKVKAVRIVWAEGFDRVEAVPYHWNLEASGTRAPERPTLDLKRLDGERVEAEFRSKMVGQDWHFHAQVAAPVEKGGVFEPEPEASSSSRVSGEGASPEIAKKLELGNLGYEYTEEMLFSAVADGNVQAVKLFLDLGMSPNSKEKAAGHVLVAATVSCTREPKEPRGEIVRLLLAAGANPKAADENNASALLWASESCPVDVVKALVKAGADVNAKAKGGGTPLMMAEVFKREDVVKVLKAAGAKK